MGVINRLKVHQKIFLFSIFVVIAISILDIMSMNSGIFGSTQDYTSGNFGVNWWPLFFNFNIVLIIMSSLAYYWFGRKDFSESISLFFGSIILWFGAVTDVLFFWLRRLPVPETLPWLSSAPVIKFVMVEFYLTEVTNTLIYLLAISSLVSVYYLTKLLVKKF